MFFILSKLLGFLILPSGILLVLWTILLLQKNRAKSSPLGWLTWLLTYLLFCPAFVMFLGRQLEYPENRVPAHKTFKVAVVLTGNIITPEVNFPDHLHLKGSADRLWQALRLYKEGKAEHILISGGDTGILSKSSLLEIDLARQFLLRNGVPSTHILLDRKARNTHENAIYCSEIIKKKYPGEEILLITSAFHMKRALGCFHKAGLKAFPFPSDFIGAHKSPDLSDFTPSAGSMAVTELFWKEQIGTLIYRFKGYL